MRVKYIITLLLLIFTLLQLNALTPNSPDYLRCNDKINPVGTCNKPYFAWFVNDPDDNEIQSAYQVIVASSIAKLSEDDGDLWNSGKIKSGMQNYIYYEGKQLKSASQYYWKVRTWDKDGNMSPYSDSATFATGLSSNDDWSGAKWIKRDTQEKDIYTYYRKQTTLPNKTIKRAVVYVSASHSYELYLNGKFVGKGFNHHYPQYSYYQAWDVTAFIKGNSDNLFACLTHWYGGGQGRAKGAQGLLLKAVIEYSDSTETIIGTDKSWKQSKAEQWITGQPQRNGEGIGRIEKIDSRKAIKNWNGISFNDTEWMFATEMGKHPVSPWSGLLRPDLTRVIEKEIKPVFIKKLGNGKYIIDLGKIYSGNFKISFKGGNSGDTIKMLGGFVLNKDGNVSERINQQTNLNFSFIHNGKTAIFNPSVYLGLRYLQVENAPNRLNNDNVSFIFRHYELDATRSSFESSDQMLNKVWELMSHSLLVGAQEGFVDTPTREKGPFLGDSWSQGVPAMSVMYDRIMNWRALNEFLDSQDQFWPDGRLNAVYPNVDGARDIPDYTQSYLVWVWDYYIQTGNVEFLRTNYSRLKKIADYVDRYKNKSTGLIHKLKGGKGQYEFGIIDWPTDMRYGYDMEVESRTIVNAYAYADFKIISEIAKTLGNSFDSNRYMAKANQIKEAINEHLINKDGVYVDGIYNDKKPSNHISQHANILPYALNIAPNYNEEYIIDEIKKLKMSVGMICLRWLPESLGKAYEGEHLIDLYTNTSWDGWAKNITQGATVTWESWNAMDKNESLSHPWGAVGLLGIQNYILGIKPLAPQNKRVQIMPLYFGDKLTFAKGSYSTDQGDIIVDWNKSKNGYKLLVNIPVNVTARVYVPKCNKNGSLVIVDNKEVNGIEEGDYVYFDNVGSGEHTFKR